MSDQIREDPAHAWRQTNIGRLWLNAYKIFQNHLLEGLHAKGYDYVRAAHLTLMREIDVDGTRISTLAERLRLTKQAASQIVMECEELGLVERRPDASDGRAKVVSFTRAGRKIIDAAEDVIREFERQLAEIVGERRASAMRQTLKQFAEACAKSPRNGRKSAGRRTTPS